VEVLQCYNPHKSERFCTIEVLQRCYEGVTGCYKERLKDEGSTTPQSALDGLLSPAYVSAHDFLFWVVTWLLAVVMQEQRFFDSY
jgi:hypothetical protein